MAKFRRRKIDDIWFSYPTRKIELKRQIAITKTYLYNFYPLKPHFYILKLGFTGVYIIFLISAQKHRLWVLVRTASSCGYSLEPPRRGGSNEYPQSMFWAEVWKKYQIFLSENFHFLVVKFSVYLNRHVFVMINVKTYFLRKTKKNIWKCRLLTCLSAC